MHRFCTSGSCAECGVGWAEGCDFENGHWNQDSRFYSDNMLETNYQKKVFTEERIHTKNIETCLHFKIVRAAQLYVAYYVFILVCQMSTTFCLLQHLIIYHVMLILPSHFCRKLTCCICHSCSRKIESRCSL
jgi:hypothetical protein